MQSFYNKLINVLNSTEQTAQCIVVSTTGSTPGRVGAKMIVYESGEVDGTIGGGKIEKKVIENALKQIKINKAKLFNHNLQRELNMSCGGSMDIYIEPIVKSKQLYIFGAGHIGKALVKLASTLQFEICLIDDRKEYLDKVEIKGIKKICSSHQEILPTLSFDKNTFVVIVTYEHAHDRTILSHCIKQETAYIGMIGSKRKAEFTKKLFITDGLANEDELLKVDIPMGIDIKAETPNEIALSIAAKLIEVKNKSQV